MAKSKLYQKRFYREWSGASDLIRQEVIVKETDLFIFAERDIKPIAENNGGDIFIKSDKERIVAIYAGDSPLSNKIFIKIKSVDTPIGVCISSGTVGHSLSFGKADACVIISGACVPICPTAALVTDPLTRKVLFYDTKCIACELCIKACPPRAMELHF